MRVAKSQCRIHKAHRSLAMPLSRRVAMICVCPSNNYHPLSAITSRYLCLTLSPSVSLSLSLSLSLSRARAPPSLSTILYLPLFPFLPVSLSLPRDLSPLSLSPSEYLFGQIDARRGELTQMSSYSPQPQSLVLVYHEFIYFGLLAADSVVQALLLIRPQPARPERVPARP